MKAMILAAGRGQRMGQLTDHCPKPLLTVAKEPLIVHHLRKLAAVGVHEVVINVCYLADQIMQVIGDGAAYGVHVQYSNETAQCLDTGGGIKKALSLLGDDPFVLISADIWTDYPLARLIHHSDVEGAHLVLAKNPDFHPNGDFGLDASGRVVETGEDRWTYANLALINPTLFQSFANDIFPLVDVFRSGMLKRIVTGEVYQGEWVNVGTRHQLETLQARFS